MTKLWGPMGWVTLHSIAGLYPENPSQDEIRLIQTWIECFAATIVCPSCQGHFKKMYELYRASRPQMFASRTELTLFILRAHNTVNRRLNKKVYSLAESWATLKSWTPDYCTWQRRRYLIHIQREWAIQISMIGIMNLTQVRQLNLAETDYWSKRSLDWNTVEQGFPSEYAQAVTIPIVEIKPKKPDTLDHPISTLNVIGHSYRLKSTRLPLSLISK